MYIKRTCVVRVVSASYDSLEFNVDFKCFNKFDLSFSTLMKCIITIKNKEVSTVVVIYKKRNVFKKW